MQRTKKMVTYKKKPYKKLYKKPYRTNEEFKFISTANFNEAIASAGTFVLLNGIAQGDDNINREGRKITMKSINMKITIENTTADTVSKECRVMLVLDKKAEGVAMTAATLFVGGTDMTAQRNPNYNNRYVVIMDRHFWTPGQSSGAGNTHYMTFYKKFNIPVQYIGTGANIDHIQSNSLYLYIVGDDTTHVLKGSCMVRFTDN